MKKTKKGQGVVKGAPSAFVISLMIHAAAFMLAGLLVVFTVHKKEEKKFVPPKPVERPKMKLKKPKVQVKKTAQPKPTTRIVTNIKKASMPDIQLPEMSGISDGLIGNIGGFDLALDLTEISSPFGGSITTGNDLKGYFYNFNRDRSGKTQIMDPDNLVDLFYKFINSGWKSSYFSRFSRSLKPLYSPTICVPTVMSELAPLAFGEDNAEGYCWAVLYKGKIVYPEDITFRFWGVSDKMMAVNVDGETVLFCAYRARDREHFSTIWQTKHPKDNTYYFGEHRARPSDWITLKAGEPKDIQVLMADLGGGLVYHMLSVEVQGEEYPLERGGGGPTFPVFRTGEISRDVQDEIYKNLYPGDTCLTNGPIFRDYVSKQSTNTLEITEEQELVATKVSEEEKGDPIRTWTNKDGKTLEGRLKSLLGNVVLVENSRKKQIKIPLDLLIPEDRAYAELARPPKFEINFSKNSSQVPNPPVSPWLSGEQRPLQIFEYTFGAQIEQVSSGHYPHRLNVECFAIGEEFDADNFILLNRIQSSFIPTRENKRQHEFYGTPVEVKRMAYRDTARVRGTKYGGYLITVTDERGKIIAHEASHDFLFENLDALKKLRLGNHFDRNCVRTIPARPTEDSRGHGATEGN